MDTCRGPIFLNLPYVLQETRGGNSGKKKDLSRYPQLCRVARVPPTKKKNKSMNSNQENKDEELKEKREEKERRLSIV